MRRLAAAALGVALMSSTSCGRLQHHFFGHTTTRSGTLIVAPTSGPVGTAFSLAAAGFRAGEPMTFEIDLPNHTKFVGPSHVAGPDGKVASSYKPLTGDPPGAYQVVAVGSRGTRANGRLTVVAGG